MRGAPAAEASATAVPVLLFLCLLSSLSYFVVIVSYSFLAYRYATGRKRHKENGGGRWPFVGKALQRYAIFFKERFDF
jgi:hypothetical protein